MRKINLQSGFTLIELIVSLGVFSTVVTIAVGALLVLVAANQQLQSEQSVMTNVSFALDSMTREIRTGTDYYCDSSNSQSGTNNMFDEGRDLDSIIDINTYRDCHNSSSDLTFRGLSFVESGDSVTGSSDRVLYFYNEETQTIYRRVGSDDPMPITSTSSGAIINDFKFRVTGAVPLEGVGTGRLQQPTVTIFIDATDAKNPDKHHYLQTTITQRTLDL